MKKRTILISLLSIVLLILAGCVTTLQNYKPKDTNEVAIKALLLKWESTWNSHDTNGVLALLNDKAQMMYGKDRKIATKEKYSKILPERMKAHPKINLGTPTIKASGSKADVTVNMSFRSHQTTTTFSLINENGIWSIIGWKY